MTSERALDESLLAFSEGAVLRLAGLTQRQLRYMDEVGLLSPAISRRISPRNAVRLYDFADVVELLVVVELRRRFTPQHVRKVVKHLRSRGYERPLSELRFAVEGNSQVFFQHPDGTWEGDRRPDQTVLMHVLDLEAIRVRARSAAGRRDTSQAGRTERRRGVLGSKPVFAGTRIPVSSVVAFLRAGESTERILAAYPELYPEDVEAARDEAGLAAQA
jgi:uncharacterized protein (DUF433 family)